MSRACLAALLLAVAALPSPARADDDPVTHKKVQTYLDLAADLFKARDFEGALAELRRAESLTDLAVVRYNIARCLEELDRPAEAVGAYEQYVTLHDNTAGAQERDQHARAAIARLAATMGTLEIACPPHSNVVIAGLTHAPMACPFRADRVPAGTYEVQLLRHGHPPLLARAKVSGGRATTIAAEAFAPEQGAPPNPAAQTDGPAAVSVRFVAANERDAMKVTVDGSDSKRCEAPCDLMLTPGKHKVEVSGAASYTDRLEMTASKPMVARLGRRKGGWMAVGITSVTVGSVLLVCGLAVAAERAASNTVTRGDASVSDGLITAGVGLGLGVGGGALGFALMGHNAMRTETVAPAASREPSPPFKLVSLGLAPVPGGAIGGARLAF